MNIKTCIYVNLHAEDIFARGKVPGCALMAYFIVSTPPAIAAGSATGICRGVMSNAVMSSSPPNSNDIHDDLLGPKMIIKILTSYICITDYSKHTSFIFIIDDVFSHVVIRIRVFYLSFPPSVVDDEYQHQNYLIRKM